MATMETFFRTRRSFCSRSEAERQKPPQAGSHKSLMYLFGGKELFYHRGCKFIFQGVDQIRRRPLTVLLFRNCCKRNSVSKDNGQFQKAKLRRARSCSRVWSHCGSVPRLLRVTTKPTPTVILSTRGLYPLWLRIAVISAHVEVLRKERSGWSKTAAGGIS